jgi:hypothetical protein
MRLKGLLVLAVGGAIMLFLTAAANAHDFKSPSGGVGDTPLNSEQAMENASDKYFEAIEKSGGAAANSLFRNPTCGLHGTEEGIHPPGNP